jgi:ElaB/YqjD/DUF883 family membrane-anchored ribosome-binding protein
MAQGIGGNDRGIEGQSGSGGGYNYDAYSSRNSSGTASDMTGQAQETYEQVKRSAADTYAHARDTIADMGRQAQRAASDWTQQTCSATEDYVREKPWNALGIAAAVGVLVGLMLRR